MQRYINPGVSIVIVLAVLCVSLVLILQGETALDKQFSASMIGNTKVLNTMAISECLRDAYNDFLSKWNQECKGQNLEDKCSLSKNIADQLKSEYKNSQKHCY